MSIFGWAPVGLTEANSLWVCVSVGYGSGGQLFHTKSRRSWLLCEDTRAMMLYTLFQFIIGRQRSATTHTGSDVALIVDRLTLWTAAVHHRFYNSSLSVFVHVYRQTRRFFFCV